MDEQFEPQNMIPSQAYFGHQEILFHTAQFLKAGQNQQIKRISFNGQYNSKKWLCEKISEQTSNLSQQIDSNQYTQQQCLMYYLKRILKHIVDDADNLGMQTEHKILFLTFKYFVHLLCRRLGLTGRPNQVFVGICGWLTQLDALFFEPSLATHNNQNNEQQLIQLLKRKDYQAMLPILNLMGSSQNNQGRKRKIQLVMKLLKIRVNNYALQFVQGAIINSIRSTTRSALEGCRSEFEELFGSQKQKHPYEKIQHKDKLQIICEVLLGNHKYIQFIVKDSWPLFLSHIIDAEEQDQPIDYIALKQQAIKFINNNKSSKLKMSAQTQYFLDLISDKNLHIVYQSLLGLVAPFYAHVIGYYFYFFYEASPLLTIMQNSYILDLIRNMLEHSSQVSYVCLFLTYSFVEHNEFVGQNGQMLQPLLFHHLSVVDVDDQEEVQLFIKKINLLSNLRIQKYGFAHAKIFFNQLVDNNKLNQFVMQTLIFIATVYEGYWDFQWQIKDFIDYFFQNYEMKLIDLKGILSIKAKLQAQKKYKKQLDLFNRLQPFINKLYLLQLATVTQDYIQQRQLILQLIKIVNQCRPLLSIILNAVSTQKLKRVQISQSKDQRPQYFHFMQRVQVFIDHYPHTRTQDQESILRQINQKLQ